MEKLSDLLTRLSLQEYLPVFEDEVSTHPSPIQRVCMLLVAVTRHVRKSSRPSALCVLPLQAITDVALLSSMGAEMLRENLDELGLESAAIERLAAELFPGNATTCDEEVEARNDATSDGNVHTRASIDHPQADEQTGAPVDHPPADVTADEIQAAEAEAQWLLNPLSLLDLSHTKTLLMNMMKEGCDFQRRGQFANARFVYTKALTYEAPNARMAAALYYNLSACQRQLGQLSLALRSAQMAAEKEPENMRAWWRAADVAIALGDLDSANEAITSGLNVNPRCQPLLQLKLKISRHD
ncbi:MAG: hypothetical protein SGPRY_003395 [Prymnesium sp.]